MTITGIDDSAPMASQIRYARLAGFMYLLVDALYGLGALTAHRYQVAGNFMATAHRIAESELLYRVGLSSSLLASLCTVFLAMGLYVTVKPVNSNLALTALLFRLVEAAVFGGLQIMNFGAMNLFVAADSTNAFAANQLSALVSLHSAAGFAGFYVGAIFFSFGSIIFFFLFLKSTYIPRFLSMWGLIGSLLIPAVGFGVLLWPQHANMIQLGWIPVGGAEVVVGLWLLLKGIDTNTARGPV